MSEQYITALKQALISECATNQNGGVYEYTQTRWAYYTMRRAGGTLTLNQVCSIFSTGYFWAEDREQQFRGKDIIGVDAHFIAVKQMIESLNEENISSTKRAGFQSIKEITLQYCNTINHMDDTIAEMNAFKKCLQSGITPFYIHAENQAEYESRKDDPDRLEQLFRMEQRRYRVETEPLVLSI